MNTEKKYVICDLDGTLADHRHRHGLIAQKPKMFDKYHEAAHKDEIDQDLLKKLHAHQKAGKKIVVMTGRPHRYYDLTKTWLEKHKVPVDFMYMKADRDFRPSSVVKEEWAHLLGMSNILVVYEDLTPVVEMWKRNGVPVVEYPDLSAKQEP